jgi:hypothetical protein
MKGYSKQVERMITDFVFINYIQKYIQGRIIFSLPLLNQINTNNN